MSAPFGEVARHVCHQSDANGGVQTLAITLSVIFSLYIFWTLVVSTTALYTSARLTRDMRHERGNRSVKASQ